jgi:hypothetical protein
MRHAFAPTPIRALAFGGEWQKRPAMIPTKTGIIDMQKHVTVIMRIHAHTRPAILTVTGDHPPRAPAIPEPEQAGPATARSRSTGSRRSP